MHIPTIVVHVNSSPHSLEEPTIGIGKWHYYCMSGKPLVV